MKKKLIVISLGLALCCIFACTDQEAAAELESFKAQAEVVEQNTALVKRYVDTFNKGDYAALKEFLSPDYAVYSPSGYPEPTSGEKLIESYQGAAAAFSEFTWSIEDIFAAGDKVVCRIMIGGKTKAGVPGLPAEETPFKFSMITIMRLKDGKIAEEWQEDDQLGFARQLGMELKPKEEK